MIRRYGIKVINPNTGITVLFNGWLYPSIPSFSADTGKLMPFHTAAAIAEELRHYYPIVKIFGVKAF